MAENLSEDRQAQEEELLALESIYVDEFTYEKSREEITCEIRIAIDPPPSPVEIEAWMPCMDPSQQDGSSAASPQLPHRPAFLRSDSGHRLLARFSLSYLLPLCLQCRFPATYPTSSPPDFTLSCLWLSELQLSVLCQQLNSLWEDGCGMPILFTWVDWLQTSTLSHLAIGSHIVLTPGQDFVDSVATEGAASQRISPHVCVVTENVETMIEALLVYNHRKQEEDFLMTNQTCQVCFDERLGNEFVRIPDCWHHLCKDCASVYCRTHVREGTVQRLRCPEPECDSVLPIDIMKRVLDEKEYSRWERLLLQRTLETMSDVEYCARCEMAVVCEAEGNHVQCAHCFFNFCRECREPWHQGECYQDDEEEAYASAERKQKRGSDGSDSDDSGNDGSASKVGKRNKKRENRLSKEFMKTVKRCPKCRVPIIKSYGCNKMTCTQCRVSFCNKCGKVGGYEHFTTSRCQLFTEDELLDDRPRIVRPIPEGALRLQRELDRNPNAHRRLTPCPRCRQHNLKRANNNHICCWACQQHFCFKCRRIIQGRVTAHFSGPERSCPQHSED